jgi:hypothetical protein
MARSLVIGLSVSLLVALVGCGSSAPATAVTPTPASTLTPTAKTTPAPRSVTSKNPGGDADDPEKAALTRLASEPWGFKRDHWNTLHIPLVDWRNWKRVRLWGHPTRATHRYGDDHRAVSTTLYTPIEGPNDPERCMAKFMEYASSTAGAYGVNLGDTQLVRMTQLVNDSSKPMLVRLMDGSVESILANDDYVGALAVYQSFPGTCLVHGFAVVATNHRELAIKVRDRWVSEGAARLVWEKNVKAAPKIESR